ncbi:hypothetical protein QA811_24060 [Streptomyces sp. B21-102]|uniref:hypothetical protein n=1 Tax=unclassified Streptomyces TaxID=2593676 RepID=UPI002FF11B03
MRRLTDQEGQLRLGRAEAEQVLRRFTRGGLKHPTYQALEDLHEGPTARGVAGNG